MNHGTPQFCQAWPKRIGTSSHSKPGANDPAGVPQWTFRSRARSIWRPRNRTQLIRVPPRGPNANVQLSVYPFPLVGQLDSPPLPPILTARHRYQTEGWKHHTLTCPLPHGSERLCCITHPTRRPWTTVRWTTQNAHQLLQQFRCWLLSCPFGLPGGPVGHGSEAGRHETSEGGQHTGSCYTFFPAGLSPESITGNRDDTALDVLGHL